jgi:hypothetical protein
MLAYSEDSPSAEKDLPVNQARIGCVISSSVRVVKEGFKYGRRGIDDAGVVLYLPLI